jgi:hypothetical protein
MNASQFRNMNSFGYPAVLAFMLFSTFVSVPQTASVQIPAAARLAMMFFILVAH